MIERCIEGFMAKSRADYALETAEGEILGVTEVRRQDYESA